MNWYVEALRKYVVFQGRARRKEFWMFHLFNFIIACVLAGIEALLSLLGAGSHSVFTGMYCFVVLLPSLAVAVRRLHDTGRSGWMMLLALIPIIGGIVLFVFAVQDGQPGSNQYGPNPKAEPAPAAA